MCQRIGTALLVVGVAAMVMCVAAAAIHRHRRSRPDAEPRAAILATQAAVLGVSSLTGWLAMRAVGAMGGGGW